MLACISAAYLCCSDYILLEVIHDKGEHSYHLYRVYYVPRIVPDLSISCSVGMGGIAVHTVGMRGEAACQEHLQNVDQISNKQFLRVITTPQAHVPGEGTGGTISSVNCSPAPPHPSAGLRTRAA